MVALRRTNADRTTAALREGRTVRRVRYTLHVRRRVRCRALSEGVRIVRRVRCTYGAVRCTIFDFRLVVSKGCKPKWVSPSVQLYFNRCARFVFLSRAIDKTDSPSGMAGQATRLRVLPHPRISTSLAAMLRRPPCFFHVFLCTLIRPGRTQPAGSTITRGLTWPSALPPCLPCTSVRLRNKTTMQTICNLELQDLYLGSA